VSNERLPEKIKKEFKKLCEAFDPSPEDISASVERVKDHVNKPIVDGQTPLYVAVANVAQDLALVQALLSVKDAAVDAKSDPDGDTPLICALKSGRDGVADILLRAGADPCVCNDLGVNALRIAATTADRAVVFESVLQSALRSSGRDCVKLKTESGTADTSLLHLAASESCADQLILLLKSFPDLASACDYVNAPPCVLLPPPPTPLQVDRTPLHVASEFGAIHCVKALIAASANVDAADCEGNTPMHLAQAAEQLNKDVIAALKAAGCTMSAKNALGVTCSEVADIREELAKDMVKDIAAQKEEHKERKEKKKEAMIAELRDFLETEAELDHTSIEAILTAGNVGSMDALVKLCDKDERLLKVIKAPKAAKRLQAAVRF
jgi:ankyrin repeat protein